MLNPTIDVEGVPPEVVEHARSCIRLKKRADRLKSRGKKKGMRRGHREHRGS